VLLRQKGFPVETINVDALPDGIADLKQADHHSLPVI
jgi:hypothetical protein